MASTTSGRVTPVHPRVRKRRPIAFGPRRGSCRLREWTVRTKTDQGTPEIRRSSMRPFGCTERTLRFLPLVLPMSHLLLPEFRPPAGKARWSSRLTALIRSSHASTPRSGRSSFSPSNDESSARPPASRYQSLIVRRITMLPPQRNSPVCTFTDKMRRANHPIRPSTSANGGDSSSIPEANSGDAGDRCDPRAIDPPRSWSCGWHEEVGKRQKGNPQLQDRGGG